MSSSSGNEVDDTIRELRKIPGFSSYVILNNDGIVIKFEQMSYRTALHHSYLALNLYSKAFKHIKDIHANSREGVDLELESIRLITKDYEMIIAQKGNFTMIVSQSKIKVVKTDEKEKKEVEEKKE